VGCIFQLLYHNYLVVSRYRKELPVKRPYLP
jgi:hypothetical protein